MNSFWEYQFSAETLCLGERIKKETYRATLTSSIPYSQATGALRAAYGNRQYEKKLHAVGILKNFQVENQISSLRDVVSGTAKLPLEFTLLTKVQGKIYIPINSFTEKMPEPMFLRMGALRSKGLGYCRLNQRRRLENFEIQRGRLSVRIPNSNEVKRLFSIKVIMPVWGYLFEPDEAHESGEYVLSLFEDSIVEAPYFVPKIEFYWRVILSQRRRISTSLH